MSQSGGDDGRWTIDGIVPRPWSIVPDTEKAPHSAMRGLFVERRWEEKREGAGVVANIATWLHSDRELGR